MVIFQKWVPFKIFLNKGQIKVNASILLNQWKFDMINTYFMEKFEINI